MAITLDSLNSLNGVNPVAGVSAANDAGSADRFLKLLVTQMQNQDPLNPMDNAQITSQMAQINTVSGIEKLNTTVGLLNGQFVQMQALQGASLVGRDVTVAGNRIALESGEGVAGFELAGSADGVKVEVLNGAGRLVDTLDLGAQGAGRHGFGWAPDAARGLADGAGYTFRVVATAGAATVTSTPLMRDRVEAVSLDAGHLTLETRYSGLIDYQAVKAVN